MTIGQGVATVVGGFLFPFFIRIMWDKMIEDWGPAGGWMAAAFIVGTVWAINHGLESPMITQTGAFVDMAIAAGVGVFTATAINGGKIKGALPTVLAAIIGGILAGFILSLFL